MTHTRRGDRLPAGCPPLHALAGVHAARSCVRGGLSKLPTGLETTAARLLVAGTAFQAASSILNWLQGVRDQFAERSFGLKLATVNSVLASTGLASLVVGVFRGLVVEDDVMRAVRKLHPMMRNVLVPTAWVLLLMGLSLTLFPRRTDVYLSWTILPPITAGSIGAFYVTGFALVMIALRGGVWARTRAVVPAGVLFAGLALIATKLHEAKFAFHSSHPIAVVISWEWVLSYAIISLLLLAALVPQLRTPWADARTEPNPRSVTVTLVLARAILVGAAAALFLAPEKMATVWPWTLTPLTSRVLAAWCMGFGIALLWAPWENDRFRAVPYLATLAFIGALQLLNSVRFGDLVSWGRPAGWVIGALLGVAAVAEGSGWAQLRGTPARITSQGVQ